MSGHGHWTILDHLGIDLRRLISLWLAGVLVPAAIARPTSTVTRAIRIAVTSATEATVSALLMTLMATLVTALVTTAKATEVLRIVAVSVLVLLRAGLR